MRAQTARWVPRCAAAGSVALLGAGLVLAYVDRHLVPASLANWTVSNISGQVVNMAVPVTGFVLASRRPENRIGWLFLVAGLALGLSGFSNQYALHALVAHRVFARGPGVCLAIELDLDDRSRCARLLVLALPDRAVALPAMAPGRVVCRRGVRARHSMAVIAATRGGRTRSPCPARGARPG